MRNGPADIVQPLEQLRGDVVRAVLISDDGCGSNLTIRRITALHIRLAQKSVHAFKNALGKATLPCAIVVDGGLLSDRP